MQPNMGNIAGEAEGRPSCPQHRRQNLLPSSACSCLMDPVLAPWGLGPKSSFLTLHSVMPPTAPLTHCTCGPSLVPSPRPGLLRSCDACSSQNSRLGLRPKVDDRVIDETQIQQRNTSNCHFSGAPLAQPQLGSTVHNCEEYPYECGNMGSGPIRVLAMSPTHHFTTECGLPVPDADDIIYSRTGFPMESSIPVRTCQQNRTPLSSRSEPMRRLRSPAHENFGLQPRNQSTGCREYVQPLRSRQPHNPQAASSRNKSRSGRSPDSTYGSLFPTRPSTPAYLSDPADKIATLRSRAELMPTSELLERYLLWESEDETCPSREIPTWSWVLSGIGDHIDVPGSQSFPTSQPSSFEYMTVGHEREFARESRSVSFRQVCGAPFGNFH